jgi:hypothetical protein
MNVADKGFLFHLNAAVTSSGLVIVVRNGRAVFKATSCASWEKEVQQSATIATL